MLNTLVCLGRLVFIAKQTIKNVKDTREDADLLWDQLDRLDKLLDTIPPEAQTCESVDRALKAIYADIEIELKALEKLRDQKRKLVRVWNSWDAVTDLDRMCSAISLHMQELQLALQLRHQAVVAATHQQLAAQQRDMQAQLDELAARFDTMHFPVLEAIRDLGIEVQQLQRQQQNTGAAAVSRVSTEGPAAAAVGLCPAAVEAMVQRAVLAVLAEQGCAERLGSGDLEAPTGVALRRLPPSCQRAPRLRLDLDVDLELGADQDVDADGEAYHQPDTLCRGEPMGKQAPCAAPSTPSKRDRVVVGKVPSLPPLGAGKAAEVLPQLGKLTAALSTQ